MRQTFTKKAYNRFYLMMIDAAFLFLSIYIAYLLRFEGAIPAKYWNVMTHTISYSVVIKLVIFWVMGLYSILWRYASTRELLQIGLAVGFAAVSVIGITIFLPDVFFLEAFEFGVPRSIYVISMLMDLIFVGGVRFGYRGLSNRNQQALARPALKKRAMIIGAGDAGSMVIKELQNNPHAEYKPVVIVDDDVNKLNRRINGIKVAGNREKIAYLAVYNRVEEIILCIPRLTTQEKQKIIDKCEETGLPIKTVPQMYDIISGKLSVNDIRPVDVEDLLGRKPVELDVASIDRFIKGKKVLVTGGGGSIGSELSRQIAALKPELLCILDIYENNAYDIANELAISQPDCQVKPIIASVRDYSGLERVFKQYRPDIVFHAAAHKHVPLMEEYPTEAVKNNIFGTYNTVMLSKAYSVERFVLISTDKAVNPTNVMGATKRFCEMLVEAYSTDSDTVFAVVRFGNVLGSNGSVIPLFKKQIAAGGPVTVTHPEMIRYFMTIPEAVQLVIQAGALSEGGELFVLDMGEQVKIDKLARDLIRLSGLVPDEDIEIVYTGLRPGEKLYEELLMDEEGLMDAGIEKLHVARRINISVEELEGKLTKLKSSLDSSEAVRGCLAEVVETYQRQG